MPFANAGAGLPGQLLDIVRRSALHIPEERLLLPVIQDLSGEDDLVLAAVQRRAAIVTVCQNLQAGVADRPERKISVIEINDVRIVVVDQLDRTVVYLVAEGLVRRGDLVLFPVPGTVVLAKGVLLLIKLLRIKAFPPLSGAILLGEPAVIRNSRERALGVSAT